MKWRDVFQEPDMVGQSEYLAIHDAIATGVMESEEPDPNVLLSHEREAHILCMLQEFEEWTGCLMRKLRPTICAVHVDNVDWLLLCRQKRELVELAADRKLAKSARDALDGVIELLDHIQDEATEALGGEKVMGNKK